jgi:transposase
MTKQIQRYVGIDIHKREAEVCILDTEGQRLGRWSVPVTRESLESFATQQLHSTDEVVLEATTNTWAVVDLLTPHVARVAVSNPMRTKAIAVAKVKTDKIDARVLADLLRARYLPEVWQPDAETRRQRSLTHRRTTLVRDRTRLKNRLHAVLAERLIPVPFPTLFSKKGLAWLAEVELDEDGRAQVDSDRRLLDAVEQELEQVETKLARMAYPQLNARLLMTLPGVDMTVALGLLAAWGPIERFPSADHAASYLGLTPSTRQSAQRCYHGSITKQGNTQARWLLIQAAQHMGRNQGPLGVFFRRLKKKKNHNIAVVAGARKLAVIAYHMLKNQEPYRYAQPASTQDKLARLRIRATGKKRRGGVRKGTPRPAEYGALQGRKKIASLQQVYGKEGLPPALQPDQLPSGERRHLKKTATRTHAQQIHTERRRTPRKPVEEAEKRSAAS